VHRALDLLERFDDEHPAWTLAALTGVIPGYTGHPPRSLQPE
jgi:hypothetical protein